MKKLILRLERYSAHRAGDLSTICSTSPNPLREKLKRSGSPRGDALRYAMAPRLAARTSATPRLADFYSAPVAWFCSAVDNIQRASRGR